MNIFVNKHSLIYIFTILAPLSFIILIMKKNNIFENYRREEEISALRLQQKDGLTAEKMREKPPCKALNGRGNLHPPLPKRHALLYIRGCRAKPHFCAKKTPKGIPLRRKKLMRFSFILPAAAYAKQRPCPYNPSDNCRTDSRSRNAR